MCRFVRHTLVAGALLGCGLVSPFTPQAVAQRAGTEVAMPLRLEAGQRYTVTITDTVTTNEPRSTPGGRKSRPTIPQDLEQTSTIVFGLEVQAADRWRWTIADMQLDLTDADLPEQLREPEAQAALIAAVRLMTDLGFDCRVDLTGRCLDLTNWPAWQDRVNNVGSLIAAFAVLGTLDEPLEEIAEMRQMAPRIERFVSTTVEGIDPPAAASAFSQVYPIAAVSGRTLALGQATSFTEEWPMPYGAAPVRVSGAVTLTAVDRANQTAVVERTARGDSESMRTALVGFGAGLMSPVVQVFGDLTPEAGAQIQMAAGVLQGFLQGSNLTFEERSRGVVDLRTGLAREVTTTYVIGFKHPMLANEGYGEDGVVMTTVSRVTVTPGAPARRSQLSLPPAPPPSTPIR